MRLFLTGSTGFIGKALFLEAKKKGWQIGILIREPSKKNLEDDLGVVEILGNLENFPRKEIEKFSPDVCIHSAWITTPGVYLNSPENDKYAKWSIDLADFIMKKMGCFFIGIGSCIEYAPSSSYLVEDTSIETAYSSYARGKLEVLNYLRKCHIEEELWAWGRIFYPYGKGEHPARLCTSFYETLARGEKLRLGTPKSIKDFIEISDVVEIILQITEKKRNGLYNVGSGLGTTIFSLAESICERFDFSKQLINDLKEEDPFPYIVANIEKTRSIYPSFKPKKLNKSLEFLTK